MLAASGNAVDAMLATAITLTLVEPVPNGIGSDAYAIVWDGKRLHGWNASGRSPGLDAGVLRRASGACPSAAGTRSAFPAASRPGSSCTAAGASCPSRSCSRRRSSTGARLPRLPHHRGPVGKSRCRSSRTSRGSPTRSCRTVALPARVSSFHLPKRQDAGEDRDTKGEAFYRGELAENSRRTRGSTARDAPRTSPRTSPTGSSRSPWTTAATRCTRSRPTARASSRSWPRMLEHFDMRSHPVDGADSLHLQIEAQKLAFADARRYVADIDYMTSVRPRRCSTRTISDRERS